MRPKIVLASAMIMGAVVILILMLSAPSCAPSAPAVWSEPDPVLAAEGRKLYLRSDAAFGCVLCHGRELEGGTMGPALVGIATFYREHFKGDGAGARSRLKAHLVEPVKIPALMKHDREYLAPMPAYPNLTPEERERLLAYLLSIE